MLRIVTDDLVALAHAAAAALPGCWPSSWRGPQRYAAWTGIYEQRPCTSLCHRKWQWGSSHTHPVRGAETLNPADIGLWLFAHQLVHFGPPTKTGRKRVAWTATPDAIRKSVMGALLSLRRNEAAWFSGRVGGIPMRPLNGAHFRRPQDDPDREERQFFDAMGLPAGLQELFGRAAKGEHQAYALRSEWVRTWAHPPTAERAGVGLPALVWWDSKAKPVLGYAGTLQPWEADPGAGHPQGLGDRNDNEGAPGRCYLLPWGTRYFQRQRGRARTPRDPGWYYTRRPLPGVPWQGFPWQLEDELASFVAELDPADFAPREPVQPWTVVKVPTSQRWQNGTMWYIAPKSTPKRWGGTSYSMRSLADGPLGWARVDTALKTWRDLPGGSPRGARTVLSKAVPAWAWGDGRGDRRIWLTYTKRTRALV